MATFQIKVALVGHANVGKTMVMNALFKDKYFEVSDRCDPAAIFSICIKKGTIPCLHLLNAAILEATTNQKWRKTLPRLVKASGVVSLTDPVFYMDIDTELVFVKIPSLTEAEMSRMSHTYVSDNWGTFDCVVLVMDVMECGNTEAQLALLNFVKNMREKHAAPLIVLCNKVDDPDDAEMKTRVDKVRREVKRIFAEQEGNLSFIPISACKAFIYRAAAHLVLEDFMRLELELIDWIGKEEYGRYPWQEMNKKEQYQAIRKVANNERQYDSRLTSCNFDAFLRSLHNVLGSKKLQEEILAKQLEVAAFKVSFSTDFGQQLCQISMKSNKLGFAIKNIVNRFWALWKQAKADAVDKFQNDPAAYRDIHRLCDQLICWGTVPKSPIQKFEIATTMQDLVRAKCAVIVNNAPHICSADKDVANTSWSQLSPFQFGTIIDSICMNSQKLVFCENFFSQYAALMAARQWASSISAVQSVEWNAVVDAIQEMVPESASNPKNWGYLEWKVCQFLDECETESVRKCGTSGA